MVSVDRGLYRHFGLLTEAMPGRERRVLSLNPGAAGEQLREETLSAFARGQQVTLHEPWSNMPAVLVLARARSLPRPEYSWTRFNCEHFLCHAFGIPPLSPQLDQLGRLFALGAIAVALA